MRHRQVKAPMRRYRTPPEGNHDWLKASSPAVWVYTPALPALSHGYKSKSPSIRPPWPWQLAGGGYTPHETQASEGTDEALPNATRG